MDFAIFQVDAFTDRLFSGNPAAVCPLDTWVEEARMLAIAEENALSETAFFKPSAASGADFDLRWFTPAVEVDLCGHATLATAFVLFNEMGFAGPHIRFATASGILTVRQERVAGAPPLLVMDFPSRPPAPVTPCAGLIDALAANGSGKGGQPEAVLAAERDYCIVYENEAAVRQLRPDMEALSRIDRFAVIVTAPGESCDFVSRFFAPAQGVPEDPVTGSAHATLTPYWAERLGKDTLHGRQVSLRGGEVFCRDLGERVEIGGRAVLYLRGTISA